MAKLLGIRTHVHMHYSFIVMDAQYPNELEFDLQVSGYIS